jgi:hypothetical protein
LRSTRATGLFLSQPASLDSVAQTLDTLALGAVVAAVERAALLEPVADDPDAAVLAGRRERVDRALEAVERVRFAVHRDLKCLVVLVTAGLAGRHGCTLRVSRDLKTSRSCGCEFRAARLRLASLDRLVTRSVVPWRVAPRTGRVPRPA